MKLYKLTYGIIAAAALILASCAKNELPTFNDRDAFVAFTTSSASVDENVESGSLELEVLLTSLNGISGTVDFEITAPETGGAVEGTHYTVETVDGSKTLTFDKENPTQKIKLNIIDNDVFGGDVKLLITLVNPQGMNLGASKTCEVTISDNEHPLAFILGTFSAKGESGFGGDLDWELTIEKDADDVSKVWIGNLVPGGTSMKVYGTVNSEKTELHIPAGQDIHSTSSYDCKLRAFYGYNGEEEITTGYITGKIAEDGTITILDDFGSYAYNKGTTTGAGWYEYVMGNSVWTKN